MYKQDLFIRVQRLQSELWWEVLDLHISTDIRPQLAQKIMLTFSCYLFKLEEEEVSWEELIVLCNSDRK